MYTFYRAKKTPGNGRITDTSPRWTTYNVGGLGENCDKEEASRHPVVCPLLFG